MISCQVYFVCSHIYNTFCHMPNIVCMIYLSLFIRDVGRNLRVPICYEFSYSHIGFLEICQLPFERLELHGVRICYLCALKSNNHNMKYGIKSLFANPNWRIWLFRHWRRQVQKYKQPVHRLQLLVTFPIYILTDILTGLPLQLEYQVSRFGPHQGCYLLQTVQYVRGCLPACLMKQHKLICFECHLTGTVVHPSRH